MTRNLVGKATRLLALLLAMAPAAGCTVVRCLLGADEPDLAAIKLGASREDAESHLGGRLWSPGSADGLTYEVYQYDVERPSLPLMAFAALCIDVITLGFAEYGLAHAREFAPFKQVAVGYDGKDKVRFVSQPWTVADNKIGPGRRTRAALASGAALAARPEPGGDKSVRASHFAVLDLGSWGGVTIDGRKAGGRRVELLPGFHRIKAEQEIMVPGRLLPSFPDYKVVADVELIAGHAYRADLKLFRGWPHGKAHVFWIEDLGTGEVLYCAWPKPE